MKQILQHMGTGQTELVDAPSPQVARGHLLIRTTRSLISAGTERMLVEFGKASLFEKARQQPDRVRQVMEKVGTDGLLPTIRSVRHKLDQPLPLGYSSVGRVLEVGPGVTGFSPGDRVASNGPHAEILSVPRNLCALIPDTVSDDAAAFTVIGAIALQGIRLAQPTLGESVVVTGLGLIGQIAVQLLRAQGCRVLGIDPNPSRLALARRFGAEVVDLGTGEDPVAHAERFSRGRGVDAVLVTAATKSGEPMRQAALMCRTRGRIVLVGVAGLELSRDDFYRKELSFQVSCSYGPGRYDPAYEQQGHDYPIGHVRWTEQRNFEAMLDLMGSGAVDVAPLISHRFALDDAAAAYDVVRGVPSSMGILLTYPDAAAQPDSAVRAPRVVLGQPAPPTGDRRPSLAFVGSGNYASAVLIPAFKAAGAQLRTVSSSGSVSSLHAGRKFGFDEATTDTAAIFADDAVDAVVVTTRHDSHARFVVEAIQAGRNVFVEKPLCLTLEELASIEAARARCASPPLVMVGFNRRFAPHVVKIKALIDRAAGPKAFVMTVNAGSIPADHWTQDPVLGGGRVIGEACHFVDLLRFLAGRAIVETSRLPMATPLGDTVSLSIRFADGSIGTIHYFAIGAKSFPKERLEVFVQGRILQLDNFRKLTAYGWPGFRRMNLWTQDKGQRACAAAFVSALRTGESPIPFEELTEVARATIALSGPV